MKLELVNFTLKLFGSKEHTALLFEKPICALRSDNDAIRIILKISHLSLVTKLTRTQN